MPVDMTIFKSVDDFSALFAKVDNVPETQSIEELNEKIKSIKDRSNLKLSDGLFYVKLIRVLSEVLEQRAKRNADTFDFSDPDMMYIQWFTYHLNDKSVKAKQMFSENAKAISERFIADLEMYAREYQKTSLTPKGGPRIFDPGNVEKFIDKIIQENEEHMSKCITYRILCYKTAALWNSKHFSSALANMSEILEFFCENMADDEIRVELGADAFYVLSKMLHTISKNGMHPAVEYLDIVLDKIDNQVPVIPYILYLSYRKQPDLEEKAAQIRNTYPLMSLFSYDKFEKAVLIEEISKVNQTYFFKHFLKSLNLSDFEQVQSDNINMSPEMHQNMVDITVLEHLQAGKIEETIAMIENDAKLGVVPSMEIIKSFVFKLVGKIFFALIDL